MIRRANLPTDIASAALPRGRVRGWVIELFAIAGVSAVVFGWLFADTKDARHAALDRSCIANLHGIRVALQMYQEKHGTLPPATVTDSEGRPMHSWRVLILPHLGRLDLYCRFRLDEPWDSPHNLRVARDVPDAYRCHADEPSSEIDTSYLAVVGEGTIWDAAAAGPLSHDDQRIAIVEVVRSNIAWTEPRDLTLRSIAQLAPDSTPSLATHHERRGRFSSLAHLMLLGEEAHADAGSSKLEQLLTDGTAFDRIKAGPGTLH